MLLDELAKKIIDATNERFHRGERRQAAFFTEQVEPIHVLFREFKAAHMATFDEIRAGLTNPSTSLETLRETVLSKERRERESWMRFERFDELARFSRADPGDLYFAYLAELRRCLVATETGHDSSSIRYYRSLHAEIVEALKHAKDQKTLEGERVVRQEAVAHVDQILLRFQEYCTSVEIAYLRLRGDALVR
jgi:hypothetical protein